MATAWGVAKHHEKSWDLCRYDSETREVDPVVAHGTSIEAVLAAKRLLNGECKVANDR